MSDIEYEECTGSTRLDSLRHGEKTGIPKNRVIHCQLIFMCSPILPRRLVRGGVRKVVELQVAIDGDAYVVMIRCYRCFYYSVAWIKPQAILIRNCDSCMVAQP